jgi:hypothetical protein
MRWLHAKVQPLLTPACAAARHTAKATGAKAPVAVYGPVSQGASLSASDLQEVIGQAMKNLAFLRIPSSDNSFQKRCASWIADFCTLPSKANIRRNRRAAFASLKVADISSRFDSLSSDPLAEFEVGLVVPNYSYNVLCTELAKIPVGTASQPIVQAFWLLSGFMHACLEVGAKPLVFMQD